MYSLSRPSSPGLSSSPRGNVPPLSHYHHHHHPAPSPHSSYCCYCFRSPAPRCVFALDHFFDDKRACAGVLMVWTLSVCGMLQTLDLVHSDFMTWGPSKHTRFMTVNIDTWEKWWLLSGATFANACVTEFMTDAILPWLQNTVQDHKTQFLPYSKLMCFAISQAWCFHCNVMALFSVALLMTQIDFLLVRMAADLMVNTFTSFKFMRNKAVDPARYNAWFDEHADAASLMARARDNTSVISEDVETLIRSIHLDDDEEEEEDNSKDKKGAAGARPGMMERAACVALSHPPPPSESTPPG